MSTSIAAPKLEDVSDMLIPASSPLTLPATLPAGVMVRLEGLFMLIGWVVVAGGLNANGTSSVFSCSSSLGLSSLVASSSLPASSG